MAESTARAEKFENGPVSAPLYYLWEVPQKPIAIRFRLDALERLDREAIASFRSVTERGSEIGGVLLGRIMPGTPSIVVVEDYERVPCDYTRGPLYRFGAGDKARFESVLRRHADAAGPSPVGVFRSNTRKGLSLDADDLELFDAYSGGAEQVALLVRPFATKPSVAGFFIRENGAVNGEASALEFQLSGPELQSRSSVLSPAEASAAGAPPQAGKPPARAQVVPIASRGNAPRPAPEPVRPAAVPAAPVPAPAPQPSAPPAAQAVPQPAVEATQPEPPPAPAPPVRNKPAEEAHDPAPPPIGKVPFGGSLEEPAPRRSRLLWGGSAAAAVLLLSGTLFFYPGFLVRRTPAPAAAPVSAGALDLRVERNAANCY